MTRQNIAENSQAEMARARQALFEARALLDAGLGNGVVSRGYYVAYHATVALLVRLGLQARTHRGTQALFEQHVIVPGLLPAMRLQQLARLEERRNTAGYQVKEEISLEQARSLVGEASEFLADAEGIVGTLSAAEDLKPS